MNLKMEQTLKFAILTASIVLICSGTARAQTCVLNDTFWLQPRSGILTLNENSIRPCITDLLANKTNKLLINYNDTDESSISATELRQWLIALALPAERIILKKATTLTDPIRLEIKND